MGALLINEQTTCTVEPLYNGHLNFGTEGSGGCKEVAVVDRF